jgi:hypothetical protein
MVVTHFHHSTKEVPWQVGNRFQAENRCFPCASQVSSCHRCVGNGAITPPWTIAHFFDQNFNDFFSEIFSVVSPVSPDYSPTQKTD